MPSHDPLLSDRTEDKVTDTDKDVEEAMDVADLPQKNNNIALITTSACTAAKEDISRSIVWHYQITNLVLAFDHKAADLPSDRSIPFQKKGWRNSHSKMKAELTSPPSTNLNHWSRST